MDDNRVAHVGPLPSKSQSYAQFGDTFWNPSSSEKLFPLLPLTFNPDPMRIARRSISDDGRLFGDRYTASMVSVMNTHSCLKASMQTAKGDTVKCLQTPQQASYPGLCTPQKIMEVVLWSQSPTVPEPEKIEFESPKR